MTHYRVRGYTIYVQALQRHVAEYFVMAGERFVRCAKSKERAYASLAHLSGAGRTA